MKSRLHARVKYTFLNYANLFNLCCCVGVPVLYFMFYNRLLLLTWFAKKRICICILLYHNR